MSKLIEERQKVIDRLFPDKSIDCHSFNSETCLCEKCGVHFAEWAKNNPIRLCPVIGIEEVQNMKSIYEDWK